MGILRSVGGWGEVDLDQRAITTEDDIVDLSELDRSHDQANQPAPATQNGAAEHDELGEGQPPAAAISADRTTGETPPTSDAPGRESDEDFDRWVADRAPRLGGALAASEPNTPQLVGDAREPASDDAPGIASGTADVPCDEATVPAVTGSRSRLRPTGALSRPLGRLDRPAAAIAALALTAGGTAFAINAATTSTPHARPAISTSHAPLIAGQSNPLGDALSATIAAVAPDLRALSRAVPPAHGTSHSPRKPRRHHASRPVRVPRQQDPTPVSERSNATQAPPASTPAPQTQNYTPPATSAASSTSHSTGSQPSSSQPAGPTRSSPLGGIGSCVSGCT